jgi:hypothetical protein
MSGKTYSRCPFGSPCAWWKPCDLFFHRFLPRLVLTLARWTWTRLDDRPALFLARRLELTSPRWGWRARRARGKAPLRQPESMKAKLPA